MTPTLTRTVNDHTCKPTAREHQIWQLLATTGDSNKELARRMGIAPGTVRAHLERVMGKLGVRGREKLIVLWWEGRSKGINYE